jgi:O-antigen/teichoic acid export membrane protein
MADGGESTNAVDGVPGGQRVAGARFDGHMSDLLRGSAVAGIMKVVEAASKFAFNVIVARQLGAAGVGLFFLAFTLVTIAATLGRAGFDRALLRHIAACSAERDWSALRDAARWGPCVVIVLASVTSACLYGLAPWFAETVFSQPNLMQPLTWLAWSVVPLALLTTYAEMLRALKRMFQSQFVIGTIWPVLGCAALIVLPASLEWTSAIVIGAMTVAALCGWALFGLRLRDVPRGRPKPTLGDLSRQAWPMAGVALMQILLTNVPLLVLGAYASASEIGVFGAANRASVLITVLLATVNAIAAPKIAALYRRDDRPGLSRTFRQAALLMTLAAAPVVGIFVMAPDMVLRLFGPEFVAGGQALAIMALGQMVSAIVGPVGNMQTMTAHATSARNINIAGMIMSVALSLALIPSHGMIGAALATALPIAAINLAGAVQIWRQLGIVPLPRLHRGA